MSEMVRGTYSNNNLMEMSLNKRWIRIKINDYLTIGRGFAFKSDDYKKSGIPIVRVSNISDDGKLDMSSNVVFLGEKNANEYISYMLDEDDILLVMVGATVGKMAKVSQESVGNLLNQNMWRLVVKNCKFTSQRFAYYALQPLVEQFLSTQQGSAREFLTQKSFALLSISLPPLSEQQKIASILTSVDEVIEKTELQISKLQDLKQGMMQELLTQGIGHTQFKDSPVGRIPVSWEITTTGSISRSIVPGRNKPKLVQDHIPWIGIEDFDGNYLSGSKRGLGVTRESLKSAKGKTIPKNSVVTSIVGNFGFSAVTTREIVINQQLHCFICNEEIEPLFLSFCLQQQKQQMETLSTQTTISYLNKENVESVIIPLPPLAEQEKIVSILTSIDSKIEVKQQKLQQTQNLKKSMMQDLLTGKVRVSVN